MPEAEIIAGALGVRTEGIPCLNVLDRLLGHMTDLILREDNQAMIRVIETGKNPTM